MISNALSFLADPFLVGAGLFVSGVAWRGLSERPVRHSYPGGFVQERVYSVWADVLIAAGVVIFLIGVIR